MKLDNMTANRKTVAFVDGVNLHKGVLRLGWKLDYELFREYLVEFYGVSSILLFVGYLPQNRRMYQDFRKWGYSLVFKPTSRDSFGAVKGNCDTDLAVQAVAGCCESRYDKAVLVTGDGDFASLSSFLANRGKLEAVVAPSYASASNQFRLYGIRVNCLEPLRSKLEYLTGEANEFSPEAWFPEWRIAA